MQVHVLAKWLLPSIFINPKYGWCRFVWDESRYFTDYSIIVHSSGWRSDLRASERAKWLAAVE
ncbi:hypothetical protein Hanom_Chr05g00456101 [Helianthus anomalus]